MCHCETWSRQQCPRTLSERAGHDGAGFARTKAPTSPLGARSCCHAVRRQQRSLSHSLGVTNCADMDCMMLATLPACCTHAPWPRINSPASCAHNRRSRRRSDDLTTSSTSNEGAQRCRHGVLAAACCQSTDPTACCAWQVVSRPVRCVHDVVRLGEASRSCPSSQQASACNPHTHLHPRHLRCARVRRRQ